MPRTSMPPTTEGPDCRFAGYGFQNWFAYGEPPVVANPAATLHSKLSWCWGEMKQIDDLASVLCTSENEDLARIGNLLLHKAVPLIAMLEHVAENTAPDRDPINPIDQGRGARS